MTAFSIQPTFPIFTESDGLPLEAGYIWLGEANLDPQGNPINVYWDAALTIAAPQPIRTLNGYPSRNGTPARMYVNSDYSIRVQNSKGSLVYSAPQATERYDLNVIVGAIDADQVAFTPYGAGAVARTVQDKLRDVVSVKDFGAVGDAAVRSANKFYTSAALTVEATDDTAALQAAFAYAHTLATGYRAVAIDLCGLSLKTTQALHITKNQIIVKNGQICQATEAEDVLTFDGETINAPLMYVRLDNVSLQHAFTSASAGALIRNKRLLGFFEWDGKNIICEGGFRGFMHDGGTIFESTLQNIWINKVWGSGFYMPANGEVIDPSGGATYGGSTTTYLKNCFVSDVQTNEPAYDIGNKFNTVILDACAADKVCSFGRFDVIQGSMRQCSSEEIRHPIVGTLPNPHYIIEVFTGYGFSVDGFALAILPGFATVAGNHAFISTSCPLKISGISGATPNTNYAGIRTSAAIVDGNHGLVNCGPNITLNGGRVLPTGGDLVLNTQFLGPVATNVTIFTAPNIPLQSSKKYIVEFTYNFAGFLTAPVWLVVMSNDKSKVTLLSDGPDQLGDMVLSVVGNAIRLRSAAIGLTGPVSITEIGAWTR